MTKPIRSIIVARSRNGVIGKENKLLWHISEDLKRFKSLTLGHPIIMGRKTYESIGRPLPERQNIIITRNKEFLAPDCVVVGSLEEALEIASEKDKEEIFIIGGAEIYKQAFPLTDRLYITEVNLEVEGDAFFPDYQQDFQKETFHEEKVDEKSGIKYTWLNLER